MKTETIIRNHLSFLENDFGLVFELIKDKGSTYSYKNEYGKFEYYEWMQFGESRFTIYFDNECRTINMINEAPKDIGKYNHEFKGMKVLFKDRREQYWQIIETIVRKNINDSGTLFGLKLK